MAGTASLIFFKGFMISLGLIVAIGPQNAYVLRKGLKRRHVFAVASACFFADAVMLVGAVWGTGLLTGEFSFLAPWMTYGGAAFLFWFGWKSFLASRNPEIISDSDLEDAGADARGKGVGAAVMMALALSFLNPHAIIDTFIVLGGIAAQFQGAELTAFGLGAIAGSGVWFYGLGYGASFMVPLFRNPMAWRVMDLIVGVIMWMVAVMLVWNELFEAAH